MGDLTRLVATIELNNVQFKSAVDETKRKKRELKNETRKTGRELNKFSQISRTTARNVAVIQGPLGSVAGRMNSVATIAGSGVGPAMLGVGAAFTLTTYAIYESLTAFAAAERSQLRTQALLKSTGYAAGLTAEQLEDMAFRVGKATLASTDGIRQAQGILLSFKSVQGDTFERAIELSQDLAEVMGTSATSSALQLGKALEDPTVGLTALRRAGVSFTQEQQDMIKQWYQAGEAAKAQGYILDTLSEQIGGAGLGAGGGLAGRADYLTEVWSRLLEKMSDGVAGESAGNFLDTISAGVEGLINIVDPSLESQFNSLYDQRAALQQRINDMEADKSGDQTADAWIDSNVRQLQARADEVEAAYSEVVSKIEARNLERVEAERKGEEAAKLAADERAAEQLTREQEKGDKTLAILQKRLDTESEQMAKAHQDRLDKISQLQVSEEELRRAGFESIDALRAEYRQRELDQYEEEQIVKAERREQEIAAEVEANEERLRQIQKGLDEFQRKKDDADKKAAKKKQDLDAAVADNAISLAKGLFKEGSTAQKLALVAEKTAAVLRIRMKTEEAFMAAMAADPSGVTGAKVRVQGGLALAAVLATGIEGIAHSGLENVPREGTYLLNEGEAVLQPRQNEDLRQFLNDQKGKGGVTPNLQVVVNEAPGVGAELSMTPEGILTIDMVREDLANGGEISRTLGETHGLQPLATRG